MDDVGDGDRLDGSVDGWDRACEVRERRCVAESHRFVAAMATVLGSAASHRRSRRRRTTSRTSAEQIGLLKMAVTVCSVEDHRRGVLEHNLAS